MKIKSIREIEPEISRCISVDAPNKLFAISSNSGEELLTRNSVSQQNIIIGCLLRPEYWNIIGIDLKRVELTRYKKFGLAVAVTLEEAEIFLKVAQNIMMERYAVMQEEGVNNFLELSEHRKALLVMVDEAGELLSDSGGKSLIGSTLIPTPNGYTTLEELQIGDTILDNYSQPTKVLDKYTPIEQDVFKLCISKDSTKDKEEFVAGAEHLWVVHIIYKNGEVVEKIVDTTELFGIKNEKNVKAVKFKRHN